MVGVKIRRMKNSKRKIGWKMIFSTVWLRVGGGEKSGGAHKFSLLPSLQNTISPNWKENWSEKWEKYLDKIAPTSFNVSSSLFFCSFFLWTFHFSNNAGFLFFCFFVFFVFVGTWWVFLFLLILFYYYFFFKKTLLDNFYAIF